MFLDLALDPAAPAPAAPRRFEARLHESLGPIAAAWRTLETAGAATAYQRLDWVRQILAHVADAERARPLLVEVLDRDTGRPAMIVPLALVRRRAHRVVTWFDLGLCDYAAPLLAEGQPLSPAEAVAAWAAVLAVLPHADLIHIRQVPARVGAHPNPIAALPGRRPMALSASGVAIDGDAETLLQRLCRSSTLRDLGKQRRRLERAGPVRFARAGTADEVEDIFAALVEQRRARFAALGRFDLLARPEIESFYRAAALDGLSSGPVKLFGLSVDGAWIAAAYGLVHGATFHGILLTTSMEDAWRNASPGLQIVADCLRWARAEGVTYFDFTVGDLPYKKDFGVETRALDEVVQPLTPVGRSVVAAMRVRAALETELRRHPAWAENLRRARRAVRKLGAKAGPDRPGPRSGVTRAG
ncbi:GNAT family N-acetyltransferase [Lichenibacterium minor]|uniref:GNAT family N-acetyltransferase n=1 Tax=Lichenibacterium minor TaxID=2316528 RepID=A0A4Q2U893_9HYPH|nr:GNAT family N-acetyltransferase [Lichenibacterium minor]RYC32178.1 GNAT family N-acetyltransferase [Lichenibacterium minor]